MDGQARMNERKVAERMETESDRPIPVPGQHFERINGVAVLTA